MFLAKHYHHSRDGDAPAPGQISDLCVGGIESSITQNRKSLLATNPAILVGTPGRLKQIVSECGYVSTAHINSIGVMHVDKFFKNYQPGLQHQNQSIFSDFLPLFRILNKPKLKLFGAVSSDFETKNQKEMISKFQILYSEKSLGATESPFVELKKVSDEIGPVQLGKRRFQEFSDQIQGYYE